MAPDIDGPAKSPAVVPYNWRISLRKTLKRLAGSNVAILIAWAITALATVQPVVPPAWVWAVPVAHGAITWVLNWLKVWVENWLAHVDTDVESSLD